MLTVRWLCLGLALWAGTCLGEDQALARLFADKGASGTLVIASLDGQTAYVHDEARAARRLPAASTFKIPNTLIALEEKAIAPDEVLRWDGQLRELPDWNRDQTLESAFRASCVWCYQELARRLGPETYRRYLGKIGFGELSEPFPPTRFWLDGQLRISANEQVEFLRRVVERRLPFSPASFDTLRRIMVIEATPAYTLRGKSGWATVDKPGVGWFVGTLETRGQTWLFALNIDTRGPQDLPLRLALVRAALRASGLLP